MSSAQTRLASSATARGYPRPARSPPGELNSTAATVHPLPGPLGGEPTRDGVGEWSVEGRSVGPYPGLHRDVPLRRGRRIEVDAADDVVVTWVEDGEGEPDVRVKSSACRR